MLNNQSKKENDRKCTATTSNIAQGVQAVVETLRSIMHVNMMASASCVQLGLNRHTVVPSVQTAMDQSAGISWLRAITVMLVPDRQTQLGTTTK
jgi:hypothetical protein